MVGFSGSITLLTDPHQLLQQQGSLQSARIIKFYRVEDIEKLKNALTSYILEAIAIEESGKKVAFEKNPEPFPDELLAEFDQDPEFKKAFFSLTPGRQRGYIIYFSQPKQSQTRRGRIEKCKALILKGIGLNDKYSG